MQKAKVTNGVDARIGANVRAIRLDKQMSQEALADAIGLTFQQVQKYEKGMNRIAGSRLVQLAKVFDVPLTAFFDGVNTPKSAGGPSLATRFLDLEGAHKLIYQITYSDSNEFQEQVMAACIGVATAMNTHRRKSM